MKIDIIGVRVYELLPCIYQPQNILENLKSFHLKKQDNAFWHEFGVSLNSTHFFPPP